MASDSNIKLLLIVHKKYNRSLPTKYFNFVVHSFAYPNLHIGQNLRFSLDKITGPNRTRKNMYTIAILTYGSLKKIPNFIKLLLIVHKKYNRSLPTKYFNFVPLVHSFAYPNLHIGQNLRFSLDKITGPNRTRKNMYTIAILTYGSFKKIPNFMILKKLKQVTQDCFYLCCLLCNV